MSKYFDLLKLGTFDYILGGAGLVVALLLLILFLVARQKKGGKKGKAKAKDKE
jgi:hypothetical protein